MLVKEVVSLKQAILATLHYFDLFDFPLTLSELEEYLYGWSAPKEVIAESMRSLEGVEYGDGFYFLAGRQELVEIRRHREKTAQKLWKKVQRYARLFVLCPFVRMVAVCNTLAYWNTKETSDIDLFVITAPGRMNTARFFMKFLTQIFGIRVHHEKIAGRFCLSFFVIETSMNLSPIAHSFDPHLAYFVLSTKPFFGFQTHRDFLKANEAWVGRYFRRSLQWSGGEQKRYPAANCLRWISEKILSLFGGFGESYFAKQLERRDQIHNKKFPKSTSIIMRRDIFKFHEHDPREEIAKKFLERLAQI